MNNLSNFQSSSPPYEKYDLASHDLPFITSPNKSEHVRTLPYMTPRYSNTAPLDTEESLLVKRIHDNFVNSAFRDEKVDHFMDTIKKAVHDRYIFEDHYIHLKQKYDKYLEIRNKIIQLKSQISFITPEQYANILGSLMYDYTRQVVALNSVLNDLDSQVSFDALQNRCRTSNYCSIDDNGPCYIKDGQCDYRYDQTSFDNYFNN